MEYTNGTNKITVMLEEGKYALLKRDTEFEPFSFVKKIFAKSLRRCIISG